MNMQSSSAHHEPSGCRSARRGSSWWIWTTALAGTLAAAWWGVTQKGWLRSEQVSAPRGAVVARGPLRISVIERGNLKAAESISLKSEIEGQTTILFLVPEGTQAKQGDLLCELDATQLVDKKVQQEISVRNAEAAFVKSRQNYDIQKSQNESDVAKAEQELDFARQDLRKFLESDRDLQRKKSEEEITLCDEEFARAREKLAWSEKLAEKGFLTTTELEADRLSENRARILRDQAERELKQQVDFEFPRQVAELEGALAEANRELERVKLQAAAKLVDFEADLKTNEAKLALEREKLGKLERQIARARLIAPKAGMVVYAKQEEGGRFGQSQPIAEGTSVRERQEIITIPNAGGMTAQVSVHESVLKQVRKGQNCLLKVDSLPGQEFHGQVQFVAMLPDQNSWWANPNTRVYRTDVSLLDTHPEMRPGMSCSIEILVEDIEDALYVPVQAVFRHGAGNVAFVAKGQGYEVAQVEVGSYNEKWVQVRSGLSEGAEVLMAVPEGFKLEPTPPASPGIDAQDGALRARPEAGPSEGRPRDVGGPAPAGESRPRPSGESGGQGPGLGGRSRRGAAPAAGQTESGSSTQPQ